MKSSDYLLNRSSLPVYNSFNPEDAEIFLDNLISEAKSVILEVENNDQTSSWENVIVPLSKACLLYTSPSPRDATLSRMPSSA